MGLVGLLGAFVVLGGSGVLMALVGVAYLSTYRDLRRSEPADVPALADPSGAVEFAGTVTAHEDTVRSPFTDTDCVVCEWQAAEYNPNSRHFRWTSLDSGSVQHPFLLETASGTVLVDPESAGLHLRTTETVTVDPDDGPPVPVSKYLDRTDDVDSEHDEERRYEERRIDPGDDLHVYGPVRETDPSETPRGVDAVVGAENPDERTLQVSEITLSKLRERIAADTNRYVITNADEVAAERNQLWLGLGFLAVGLLFVSLPFGMLLVG